MPFKGTVKHLFIAIIIGLALVEGRIAIACDPGTYDNGAGSCSNCNLSVCSECDTSPSSCTACQSGSYLSGTSCVTCPTGCSTCLSDSACQTCQSGYVSSGPKCITEAQARSNNTASSSSGLGYGWIIAITAGGAIVLGLAIWGLIVYLKKKPAVQKLDDTMAKPPQDTIDLFKALFAAQASAPPKTGEGEKITNTSIGESTTLKGGKVDPKSSSKGKADEKGQAVNLGALFGGMMSTQDKAAEVNAPKAPPPFLMAMSNIPGFSVGNKKDTIVDTQKTKAKAPQAAPTFSK